MQHGELSGRVALITGAGSGLGAAFARRLAQDGATIVVNDMNDSAAKAVADEVSGEPAVFDVTDAMAFDAAVDGAVAAHGRLDIVVNNAGIAPPPNPQRFEDMVHNQLLRMEGRIEESRPLDVLVNLSDEEWDRMVRIHLYGCFHGTRAALRHMTPARSGAIVNISSVLGLVPSAGAPHYSTAKAAIIALTKAAAQEVAPLGIRVNAVCPGWVDTPLLEGIDGAVRSMIVTQIPVGRMAEASEIAEVVRFLVGDGASYVTGSAWSASGGFA
jgi:NAD(P)-dependent dehydrogenase (short-subunit alcohol dehydrogenase family)